MINADKPHLWKEDIAASVDLFNRWFLRFAPKTFRDTRIATTKSDIKPGGASAPGGSSSSAE